MSLVVDVVFVPSVTFAASVFVLSPTRFSAPPLVTVIAASVAGVRPVFVPSVTVRSFPSRAPSCTVLPVMATVFAVVSSSVFLSSSEDALNFATEESAVVLFLSMVTPVALSAVALTNAPLSGTSAIAWDMLDVSVFVATIVVPLSALLIRFCAASSSVSVRSVSSKSTVPAAKLMALLAFVHVSLVVVLLAVMSSPKSCAASVSRTPLSVSLMKFFAVTVVVVSVPSVAVVLYVQLDGSLNVLSSTSFSVAFALMFA